MKTLQEIIHDLYLQLERENDLLNGYRSKVQELEDKIRHHAFLISNGDTKNMLFHAAAITEYYTDRSNYMAEIEMLEKSIEIAHNDIAELESEVK